MSFEKLNLRDGRVLVIDSLEGQLQLQAFRRFLGTALHPQLEVTPPSFIPAIHHLAGRSSSRETFRKVSIRFWKVGCNLLPNLLRLWYFKLSIVMVL